MRVTRAFPALCLGLSLLLHHAPAFAGTLDEALRSRNVSAIGLAAGSLDAPIAGEVHRLSRALRVDRTLRA